MPYVAKLRREDPFRPEDAREVEAACRRVAAASEFMVLAGWREDSGYRVYHFTTWAKARAMQHWIDRSGIAHRPMPKLGLTAEEVAERKRQALAWGLRTGAARPIMDAYRRARCAGDAELTAFNAALIAKAMGRPTDGLQVTVRTLLEWARARLPISSDGSHGARAQMTGRALTVRPVLAAPSVPDATLPRFHR